MADRRGDALNEARSNAGLSHVDLFFRYFALGGMSSVTEVEAFLASALIPSDHDHDVIAHALNERFVELGRNHPVPYSDNRTDGAEGPTSPGREGP